MADVISVPTPRRSAPVPEGPARRATTLGDLRFGIALALLSLLPALLGGGIAVWSRAILFLVAGTLFLAFPPRHSLGLGFHLVGLVVVVFGACSFLPAAWFPAAPWRSEFSRLGLPLASTRSPQPWLSAEAFATLLLGVCWTYYVLARRWGVRVAHGAVRAFAVGALSLAGLALLAHFTGLTVPFWLPVENGTFGFFPNRNQTADFFAVAGLIIAGLALDESRFSPRRALVWLCGLIPIFASLVLTTSRAGLLLFVGGLLVLMLCASLFFRMRIAFRGGMVLLSLLAAGFLMFGGQVLDRLTPHTGPARQEFRSVIHADALHLTGQDPWLGLGLGNFEPLFRLHRESSRLANYASRPDSDWAWQIRTVHPESDWLWAAVEMGWPVPAALLLALFLWGRRCFPFAEGTGRVIRLSAAVAGLAFVVHGFMDVSGHRLGTLWAAAFVLSLAIAPHTGPAPSRWLPILFRGLGGIFLLFGSVILFCFAGAIELPTSERVWTLRQQLDVEAAAGHGPRVEKIASEALAIAPLEWSFYFQRAVFRATSSSTDSALRDFRIARTLEPFRAQEFLREGALWASLDQPAYALEAWLEVLRRSPDGGGAAYRSMLSQCARYSKLHFALEALALAKPALMLVLLELDSGDEFDAHVAAWLASDPDLTPCTPSQRDTLVRLWQEKGNPDRLHTFLVRTPQAGMVPSASK